MTEQPKRIGRPPEGSGKKGEPERIRDYPKLLVTIRPAVRSKLKAMASVEKRPAWQIVEDALARYFEELPQECRRAVQSMIRREFRS
jgi:predicted NAD/FAD-binding protein